MNPAFIILVILGAVFVWLLCSFLYVPIGEFFNDLLKDANKEINNGGKIDFLEKNKGEDDEQ